MQTPNFGIRSSLAPYILLIVSIHILCCCYCLHLTWCLQCIAKFFCKMDWPKSEVQKLINAKNDRVTFTKYDSKSPVWKYFELVKVDNAGVGCETRTV